MPLTLAHPAAVLPLRGLGLPLSALVIGSMFPDVPLFLWWPAGYGISHSTVGVLTLDVLATMALLACWNAWVRDALVDLAPDAVRRRLPARHRLTAREWVLAPVAATVGAATHVVWDAFTHRNRWGVDLLPVLRDDWGPLPGFKWAQYASGVLGLLAVLAVCWSSLRSRPADRTHRERVLPAPTLPLVVTAAAMCGLAVGLSHAGDGFHDFAFFSVVAGIAALSVGLVALTLAWVSVRGRDGVVSRRGGPPPRR